MVDWVGRWDDFVELVIGGGDEVVEDLVDLILEDSDEFDALLLLVLELLDQGGVLFLDVDGGHVRTLVSDVIVLLTLDAEEVLVCADALLSLANDLERQLVLLAKEGVVHLYINILKNHDGAVYSQTR